MPHLAGTGAPCRRRRGVLGQRSRTERDRVLRTDHDAQPAGTAGFGQWGPSRLAAMPNRLELPHQFHRVKFVLGQTTQLEDGVGTDFDAFFLSFALRSVDHRNPTARWCEALLPRPARIERGEPGFRGVLRSGRDGRPRVGRRSVPCVAQRSDPAPSDAHFLYPAGRPSVWGSFRRTPAEGPGADRG